MSVFILTKICIGLECPLVEWSGGVIWGDVREGECDQQDVFVLFCFFLPCCFFNKSIELNFAVCFTLNGFGLLSSVTGFRSIHFEPKLAINYGYEM